MTNQDVKREVIRYIKTLPVCIPNSQETQWTVRCPYCGDSKNPDHGHFSIKIDVNSDGPMLYRCFKCPSSGILTPDVLDDIGCKVDNDFAKNLNTVNKNSSQNNPFMNIRNKKYIVPLATDSRLNFKKEYINSRLGLDLTYEELRDLKVVFDIYDFMKANSIIEIPNVSSKFLSFINSNYVGFLSNNNCKITWRCVKKNPDYNRYIKLNLDPYNISPNNFYMIPNSFDLLYTSDMNIHIAEGTFDIISIYKNVCNCNNDNNLYYACCGFSYNTILRYILNVGINTNLNIHIYSDNDKSNEEHEKYLLSKYNKIWFDHIYIHRNIYPNEKDYGVPRDRIKDSILQIK